MYLVNVGIRRHLITLTTTKTKQISTDKYPLFLLIVNFHYFKEYSIFKDDYFFAHRQESMSG